MNKLIPVLLGAVAIIVLIIGWLSFGGDTPPSSSTHIAQPVPPPLPDGKISDPEIANLKAATSYAAQLKGATGQIQSLERQLKVYVTETDKKIAEEAEKIMRSQLPAIEKRLREEIRKETEQKAWQDRQDRSVALPSPNDSNRVVDAAPVVKSTPAQTQKRQPHRLLDPALADIPSGLGFDDLESNRQTQLPFDSLSGRQGISRVSGRTTAAENPGYTKITAWQPNQSIPVGGGSNGNGGVVINTTAGKSVTSPTKEHKPKPIPVYTIENTSTLFSNTTMTALMGVVPSKNNAVKNLMRFKVITGADNIASNGLFLPDVKNIIWTGYAIGNREMECVQATVDTITFTFQDGTIRTVRKKQGNGQHIGEGLGYLSDRWGKPCIKGTLISNAAQYLRDRMIAAGAAATASAAAAMQTTTTRDALGGSSTVVTGSEGDYIAGQTGTATLNELAAYLRDRMDQAVDIVYLDAGKDVVIHVEEQIDIDYDPVGRKLSHVALSQQAAWARKMIRLD